MHKTDEHANSYGQRYSITCQASTGISGSKNHEHQYKSKDKFHHKCLGGTDTVCRGCDSERANRVIRSDAVNYGRSADSWKNKNTKIFLNSLDV